MAGPWEKYGSAPAADDGPWSKYGGDPVATQAPAKPAAQPKGTGSAIMDGINAVTTGINRGVVRLAGLPVDTAANVVDLLKIAPGVAYTEITGKAAPDFLQPMNRENVGFTGDWLLKQARKTSPGRAIVDPVNPDYEGGYLQAAGGGATAAVNPQTRAQLVNQLALGVSGSLASKAAYDATGSNAAAIIAGMLPLAGQYSAVGAGNRMIRGNEQGRQNMAQRVQDLQNAGVERPTLGLASGNQLIGGLENILQSTPGAVGVMRRSRDAAVNGLENKAASAAAAAADRRGALEAGRDIQSGIQGFRDSFKTNQRGLYDRLDQYIDPLAKVDVSNTKRVLSTLNEDIPGAPELSKQFKNSRIQSIESAIASDTAGAPPSVMVYAQPPVGGGGLMNPPVARPPILVNVPQSPPTNQLPFQAVKKTRTLVGDEIADTNLLSSVPRSKWNPLYGALSNDMQAAAVNAGPQAEGALSRANAYTRAGLGRIDRLQPFADKAAPEQAFTALERTLGENVSTLQAVKKSLPEGARGTVAGTVIERLGKARASAQNEAGDAWSPETFLTSWNKMTPAARKELFSGFKNADQVAADVNSVAKAASMMRENSKMWANPSGTGANMAARGTLGLIGGGLLLNPAIAATAGGGVLSSNLLARGLTSKWAIDAAMRRNKLSPQLQGAALAPILSSDSKDQQ